MAYIEFHIMYIFIYIYIYMYMLYVICMFEYVRLYMYVLTKIKQLQSISHLYFSNIIYIYIYILQLTILRAVWLNYSYIQITQIKTIYIELHTIHKAFYNAII